jgi:hypothetical protein
MCREMHGLRSTPNQATSLGMVVVLSAVLPGIFGGPDWQPEAVGWWVGDITSTTQNELALLDWDLYTIIRPQFGPNVATDGSCSCNLTALETAFVATVHQRGLKVQAGPNLNVTRVLPVAVGGAGDAAHRDRYIATIGAAVTACGFDGLEFDYEPLNDCSSSKPNSCIMTPEHATSFTVLLADIKRAMGSGKLVSEDMGVWGLGQGSYPLMLEPWINVSMLNAGAIDFINTMSYHHPLDGTIAPWKSDAAWMDRHGIDRRRVNLGIPYYSFNGSHGEPIWRTLSKLCPDAAPEQHVCHGVTFCGKDQNHAIGAFVREQGFRGVFPWAANYDSFELNNTLAVWLGRGLRGE